MKTLYVLASVIALAIIFYKTKVIDGQLLIVLVNIGICFIAIAVCIGVFKRAKDRDGK